MILKEKSFKMKKGLMFDQKFIASLIIMPCADFILIKIFNKKARWFQLHAFINSIITYLIFSDTYKLISNPILPLDYKNENTDTAIFLVWFLHAYHFLIENLTCIELIHHILFVAFGTVPMFIYYNNIVLNIFLFTGCGLPGAIEYTMLSLVKNNYLASLRQKKINSFINNYLRCPLSIYGVSLAYINMQNVPKNNVLIAYYVIFLVYINATVFSKMAIENYIWHKLNTILDIKYNT